MSDMLPPCDNDKSHGEGEVVFATGIDDFDLPIVKRVCKFCSGLEQTHREVHFRGQMKFLGFLADELQEDVDNLNK